MWSPDGDQYAVVVNDQVDIYVLKSATIIATIAFTKRISCLKFLKVNSLIVAREQIMSIQSVLVCNRILLPLFVKCHMISLFILKRSLIPVSFLGLLKNTLLAVGGDDASVRIYDVSSQKCVCEFKAHENRYEL